MRPLTATVLATLADQNDAFRKLVRDAALYHDGRVACQWRGKLLNGQVTRTPGVAARFGNGDAMLSLLTLVASFADFTEANDPLGEHNFGNIKLTVNGESVTVYWKFDYYDPTMEWGSDDPADPALTFRLLTILCSDEY